MFSQSVIEQINYYVYFLRDPRTGNIFYVGKGCGNRIFNHVACALEKENSSDKLDIIRDILDGGENIEYYILRHGLEEATAFEIESAVIDLVGLTNLSNLQRGYYANDFGIKSTNEIIAMYSAEVLTTSLPIILININKRYHREITQDELYEATRSAWVVGKKRDKAIYAIPTYRGLTREVYKIHSWYPVDIEGKQRWGFHGELAPENIRVQLKYKTISAHFPKGAANPIKYLNFDETTVMTTANTSLEIKDNDISFVQRDLNIVVHIHRGKEKHGYELGTRQAWKCGEKAHRVKRIIGVIKGKVTCVIEDVTATLSTVNTNLCHSLDTEGRYIFIGGVCSNEADILVDKHHDLMFKKIKGLGQGHRYFTDDELNVQVSN